MYPNLYYFFDEIFGWNWELLKILQTFGFMVAISFLLANYTMTLEMKRKERNGILKPVKARVTIGQAKKQRQNDLIGSGVLGFVLGYKLWPFLFGLPEGISSQEFLLSLEGSFAGGLVFAALLGGYRYWRNSRTPLPTEEKEIMIHPYEIMGNLTVAAAISGLIGAKLFHNLENWGEFIQDPIGSLFSLSGLTFYGGLIFGAATVLYLANRKGIHWRDMLDIGAPAMMLAYGVGRLGCQVSGDGDWGIVNTAPKPGWLNWAPDWLWSYTYPNNVIKEGEPIPGCVGEYCYELSQGVFPTPLYEAIACIGLFFLLWFLRKRISIPGMLFSIYLVLNGIERFLIEKIRVNNKMDFLGLEVTQAEIISFSLILIGLLGMLYFYRKPERKA